MLDILVGKKFGKLFVEECIPNSKGKQGHLYKCLCDCGNIKETSFDCLYYGHTTSCGCLRFYKHLEGNKYGKLTVIKEGISKRSKQGWECLCDCGNIVVLETSSLVKGNNKSCGKCVRKTYPDLTGTTIKQWTLLKRFNTKTGYVKYICQCVCENKKEIFLSNLMKDTLTGHCGCINKVKRTTEQEQRNLLRRNRTKIILRDNTTCQLCGVKKLNYKLKSHHILPFKSFPNLRLDSENIIVLCSKCHLLVHGGHSFNNIDIKYQKILLEIMKWKITEPGYRPIKIE